MLNAGGPDCDLGAIAALPLAAGGGASYNVANLAGAALAAAALGIPPDTIASTFAGFGRKASDNPGRLMRFDVRGMTVLVDYAHNPDGIRGLLEVAQKLRGARGRLGMLLGHAGNRQDKDFEDVARVAAAFHPDLVVVKEEDAYLRGRAPGEVPGIIRAALLANGLPETSLPVCMTEMEAVHRALEWAQPGDVLVLPVHAPAARAATVKLLEEMRE
jgi:UDP-N-acetylmuramyl tripeptide synthase